MSSTARTSRRRTSLQRANAMLADTTAASISVVASRLSALSDPGELFSVRQQHELGRMVTEKVAAGMQGYVSASAQLAALPYRMLQAAAQPQALTPAGWVQACAAWGGLWMDVGTAALQPAHRTVVGNRARLQKR